MARGSPVASLLVPVAKREQGLSSKLLAFEKQLEDHEVAVLELERQAEELERSTKLEFKCASDMGHEVSWQARRGLADKCTLEFKFKQLTDIIVVDLAGIKSETLNEVQARYVDWSLQHDRCMLQVGHRLQQLEEWADGCRRRWW